MNPKELTKTFIIILKLKKPFRLLYKNIAALWVKVDNLLAFVGFSLVVVITVKGNFIIVFNLWPP